MKLEWCPCISKGHQILLTMEDFGSKTLKYNSKLAMYLFYM